MKSIHVNLFGRFGNCMFQYAYARAYAESKGLPLTTNPWAGEKVFDLPDHRSHDGQESHLLEQHYHQDQDSLIYTRAQVRDWFRFKPAMVHEISDMPIHEVVAHQRKGDYEDLGYVVISLGSYIEAFIEMGYNPKAVYFCSEEFPSSYSKRFTEDLTFFPDFFRMTQAKVLFRGNSSFSWWAATLSSAKVYAPVIDGLPAGIQNCTFVQGNWPKLANLPGITDLRLRES